MVFPSGCLVKDLRVMYVLGFHVVDVLLGVVMVIVLSVLVSGEDVLVVLSVLLVEGHDGGLLGAFVVFLLSSSFMTCWAQ